MNRCLLGVGGIFKPQTPVLPGDYIQYDVGNETKATQVKAHRKILKLCVGSF